MSVNHNFQDGDDVTLDDTARTRRRNAILAEIEAALLAEALAEEAKLRATGADPYNTAFDEQRAARIWDSRSRYAGQ